MAIIKSFKELDVWRNAMDAAMLIFKLTRAFPAEERYSMTDQIRRSSRSVAANIAEAWRRRRYRAAFLNKLNESECEAAETQTWVEFALRCGYIDRDFSEQLSENYDRIIGQLVKMAVQADKWVIAESENEYSSPDVTLEAEPNTEEDQGV